MKKNKPFILSIVIALAVGGLSALLTRNNMSLYTDVSTPPLSPPSWVFPVVWTILFILMGISAALIYTNKTAPEPQKRSALYTYALSLLVNFFWSIIFFNLRAFLFAFLWLLLLLFLIIRTIMKYYKINKTAAYLQIPYALWVTFAGYLTFAIWWLNK
ncbi:MAG: tryptophan-rich sensory protein [Ruminococcaceae bacterium]|nr:tryptophan-rich sensory protein [Oscillospiraceae bacterium]